MSNTDRDSMLERWADGMERLEQYYEGKYGPPATPPSLPPITTRDAMLEAIADGMERAKRNINKKSPTYHSDSVAYVKTVPAGNVHYASLEQIGGKTLVFNQLNDNSVTSKTTGVTIIKDADNRTWTVNGLSENNTTYNISSAINYINGHKYLLKGCPSGGSNSTYRLVATNLLGANDEGNGVIVTCSADAAGYLRVVIFAGYEAINLVYTPQIYDLTLLYGAGNEPSTLAEFQQTFPAVWYAFTQGTVLSAGVTEVVSKKADTTEIATYSIPAEVQALEGYGWSCPDHYNYIDYEAKKFVQEVGSRAYASGDESDSTVVTDMTTTYYPLNPAVETDISAYLTDDGLIEVEVGGTLELPNQNGDDYRIPVPSSETFVVGEP